MLPELDQLKVLDMGCGPGVYAQYFIEQGAVVTAVDASSDMVALTASRVRQCKENSGVQGCLDRAYVQDLSEGLPDEPDDGYDLIVSPLTVHYVCNWMSLFSEVSRVLKSGGTFVFSTHHPMVDFQDSVSGNYFDTEYLTQTWTTTGVPVEVSFYRRPLTDLFGALHYAGLQVLTFKEGEPSPLMEARCADTYQKLKSEPAFIFLQCEKR